MNAKQRNQNRETAATLHYANATPVTVGGKTSVPRAPGLHTNVRKEIERTRPR